MSGIEESPALTGVVAAADDDAALKLAVEELFVACQHKVGRYLAQMVRDRALAEDILQDCFHDVLRARNQLPDVRNAEAWIYGIARNRALMALRKRRRLDRVIARLIERPPFREDDAEVVALQDLLERNLSSEDRALVVLHYLHGFDGSELAEMTGLTVEAVWQRLSRARKRLVAASTSTTVKGSNR